MEIERKFLTTNIPFDVTKYPCLNISQTYLSLNPTIRIRKNNNDFILTVKGSGHLSREEFELSLTEEQYRSLEKKAETPPIIKKRYLVPLEDGLTAEVDIYAEPLAGLITTEVEFSSLSHAENFEPPPWFGKDVSYDKRYKNTSLSLYGIPKES